MNWYKYIFFLLPFTCTGLEAQSLRGLPENPVIKEYIAQKSPVLKNQKTMAVQKAAVLSLPFFEDFSTSDVFPDPAKWADRYAFINNSFAIDPISIGVATLDAINEYGDVYTSTEYPASSDTLTTQDFDLSMYALTGDIIRLSFFYQCGGKGETPEFIDSLVLEYFYPVDSSWVEAWSVNMDSVNAFEQVILQVPDSLYLNGFKFRFRNYTSISVKDVEDEGEGGVMNADCWNIDYIMMNTDPLLSHEAINDIALTDVPRNMLDFYETIPWLHLNDAQSITRNSMNYDIRLMGHPGDQENIGHNYYVRDLNTGFYEEYEMYEQLLPYDSLIKFTEPFFAPFTRKDESTEGSIEVASFLREVSGTYRGNDTAKTILNFKNSYAYDDGTPEYGFGIEGLSTMGALLALKFRIFKPDTLRAIEFYFNKARGNYTQDLGFQLCVWKDGGGKPGDLLFMSEDIYSPMISSGSATDFGTYVIKSAEDIIITDTVIYAGWKQATEEFLNLGYDVNRNNLDRTFVNTSGDWENPGRGLPPGTVMIRTVFGGKGIITGPGEEPEIHSDIKVYPNPVSGVLNIDAADHTISRTLIIDISGRIVLQQNGESSRIDVSNLSPGIYQVLIYTENNLPVILKIVKNR